MPKCAFTGKEIPPGTGMMYVKKDGSILWFSSRKAEKNFLVMKRKPRPAN
jgi:large subunit ribosomal protein L24e